MSDSSETVRSIGRSNCEVFWKNPKNIEKYSEDVDMIITKINYRKQQLKELERCRKQGNKKN